MLNKKNRYNILLLFLFTLSIVSAYDGYDKYSRYGMTYTFTTVINEDVYTNYTIRSTDNFIVSLLFFSQTLSLWTLREIQK